MKYFIILFFLISCSTYNKDELNNCYGENIINKLYYKESCLSCSDFYKLYIDKNSSYIYFENKSKGITSKGQYKLYMSDKNEILLDIFDCESKLFNGEYIIEFDTILNTPQREEFKITIESNDVYIEAYKTFLKKNGI